MKNTIKQLLASRNKRAYELADFLNISNTTVSYWCSNSHQPNILHAMLIAKFFKTSVEDIFKLHQDA